MIRQPIRNISSSKQIKPRVFDALTKSIWTKNSKRSTAFAGKRNASR